MPLDIGLGIFSAVMVGQLASASLNEGTIVIAVVFALLPDVDFLLHIFKRRTNEFSHEHRDLFHNPLLFIPIGFIVLAPFNMSFAYLFLLCTLGHFLHDSVGMGWGIRWTYPFSKRYYKFFSDKQGGISGNLIISWTPEEQQQAAAQFGNPHWLKNYLKFSPELLFELLVFIAAIGLLVVVK